MTPKSNDIFVRGEADRVIVDIWPQQQYSSNSNWSFYFISLKERKRKENEKKRKKYLQKRLKKKREKKIATTTNLGRKTSSAPQLHFIERKKDLKREKRENKVIKVKMGRYQQKKKGKEGKSEDLGGERRGRERKMSENWWDLHRK